MVAIPGPGDLHPGDLGMEVLPSCILLTPVMADDSVSNQNKLPPFSKGDLNGKVTGGSMLK